MSAHKFYASLAQVERTADGRLEVALRFFPDDLEAALRKATGTRVVVEDSTAFAAAFVPWLNAVFALEAGGRRTAFRYVGRGSDGEDGLGVRGSRVARRRSRRRR